MSGEDSGTAADDTSKATSSDQDVTSPEFEAALQEWRRKLAPQRKHARDCERLTGADYQTRVGSC